MRPTSAGSKIFLVIRLFVGIKLEFFVSFLGITFFVTLSRNHISLVVPLFLVSIYFCYPTISDSKLFSVVLLFLVCSFSVVPLFHMMMVTHFVSGITFFSCPTVRYDILFSCPKINRLQEAVRGINTLKPQGFWMGVVGHPIMSCSSAEQHWGDRCMLGR